MWARLVPVLLSVVYTYSLSLLTDDKSQITKTDGETVILRQLLNQETLIRMALDNKVNDLVKSMAEMKNTIKACNKQLEDANRKMETNRIQLQDAKTEIGTNSKQLEDAKREIESNNKQLQDVKRETSALKNENTGLKAE